MWKGQTKDPVIRFTYRLWYSGSQIVRKGIHVNLITYNKLKQDNKNPKKTKIISCTINTSVLFCGGRLISLTVTFCKKYFIQATKVVKIKLGIIDEC